MILSLILALSPPTVESVPVSPCSLAVAHQKGRNALELGAGSKACEDEGRVDDAAFLTLLTQIRATADFILLPPQDVLVLAERSEFRAVFANGDEFVNEQLARDPQRFAALLDRVRQADLGLATEYHPGWAIADDDKRSLYAEVIDGVRTDKLAMESYVAKLVRDEAYFAAYLERVAILADLPQDGAQLPKRFSEVTKIMRTRMDILGSPPTESAVPWRKVYQPGANAPFAMLYRGFNGPPQSEALLFRSPTELLQSWVGSALSEAELLEVLSRVDFETELLGVYAVGEIANATENLFVTEFGPTEDFDGHSIAVRVGVLGEHCDFEPSRSYPFVLVKASSKTKEKLTATSRANYPDQCALVMKSSPTLVADSD